MKIFDCSLSLDDSLVTWPGEDGLIKKTIKTLANDGAEVSQLSFGSHTGTHIDAPRHFVAGGGSVDEIKTEVLLGKAVVIDLSEINSKEIMPNDIAVHQLKDAERVLFKTNNSTEKLLLNGEFTANYVSLSEDAAQLLVDSGIKLVGVDYLSVEKKGNPGHPVHTILLQAGIVIVEGVWLGEIPAGNYELAALPLKITGGDGAPARVLLWK